MNNSIIHESAQIGEGTKIHEFCWIGPNVKIGKNCKIQAGCFIPENVIIGDGVFIGPHVVFTNDKHPPSHGEWKKHSKTVVCDGASIGANATILPSIIIEQDATIGAGSVVTKNVEYGNTVKGNPAR